MSPRNPVRRFPVVSPDNPFLKEITMHNHSLIRRSMIAAALTLAFVAVPLSQAVAQDSEPAMQALDNQTVPDKAADAWITTKGVTATDINVTTNDGVVTLTGNVQSSMEKNHAVRVARQIKGVKSVDASGLMVGPARHDDSH
jgi:hyperosmotically inducible protein